MKKTYLLPIKLICSVILLLFAFDKINFIEFKANIMHANIIYLLYALLLQHSSFLLSCFRSKVYLRYFGLQLKTYHAIALYYAGTFLNTLLPGGVGGDVYKAFILHKYKRFPKLRSIRIFFYERLNGLAALCFLGCIIGIFSHFAHIILFFDTLLWFGCIAGLPLYFLTAYLLGDRLQSTSLGLCYSLALQIIQILSVLLIIFAIGVKNNIIILDYLLLFVIASIAIVIPITIGGIGIREIIFAYGVQLCPNLDQTTAVTIASSSFTIYILSAVTGMVFITSPNNIFSK